MVGPNFPLHLIGLRFEGEDNELDDAGHQMMVAGNWLSCLMVNFCRIILIVFKEHNPVGELQGFMALRPIRT